MSALTCSCLKVWGVGVIRTRARDPLHQWFIQRSLSPDHVSYLLVECWSNPIDNCWQLPKEFEKRILLFPGAEDPLPQWPGDCLPQVSSPSHCAALGQRREKVEFFTEPAPGPALQLTHSPHSRFLHNFPPPNLRSNCLMSHCSSLRSLLWSPCL